MMGEIYGSTTKCYWRSVHHPKWQHYIAVVKYAIFYCLEILAFLKFKLDMLSQSWALGQFCIYCILSDPCCTSVANYSCNPFLHLSK